MKLELQKLEAGRQLVIDFEAGGLNVYRDFGLPQRIPVPRGYAQLSYPQHIFQATLGVPAADDHAPI